MTNPKGPHQDLLPLDRLAVNNLLLERAPKGVSVLDCATLADAIVSRFGSRAGTRSEPTPCEDPNAPEVEHIMQLAREALWEARGRAPDGEEGFKFYRDNTRFVRVREAVERLASESERNARIVAALREERAKWNADSEYTTRAILLDRILSAGDGEPAPSEEQQVTREGATAASGSLAESQPASTDAEQSLIPVSGQTEPPPVSAAAVSLPAAQSKTLPEEPSADAISAAYQYLVGERVSGYGLTLIPGALRAAYAIDRLSLGNVVPQSGVEPESVMELAEKLADAAALEAADQIEGQHRGDWTVDDTEHHRQRIEEARQALRAALSVTPRDQGGNTK